MVNSVGISALLYIVLTIIFIAISWWALQAFRFDLFVKKPDGAQAKLLQVLLSIFIGHGVAQFFMEYLGHSLLLQNLFQ
ncbi:DUF1146 family protein [Brevibacillus humidisoli]|uniref:DUF1146 family protein n=1 Tax=Brevibacillus humidisoli TaxID=2895522 RepID=UPI001E2C8F6F|nr:DUF1146 family protein [Brevibacillus humidisoli]UFJ40149.1 DUF1146 family protein [Brevibacillus humidisoli]